MLGLDLIPAGDHQPTGNANRMAGGRLSVRPKVTFPTTELLVYQVQQKLLAVTTVHAKVFSAQKSQGGYAKILTTSSYLQIVTCCLAVSVDRIVT